MLNNIVDNIEQCGSKTLFNAVFNSPEQAVRVLLCRIYFLFIIFSKYLVLLFVKVSLLCMLSQGKPRIR